MSSTDAAQVSINLHAIIKRISKLENVFGWLSGIHTTEVWNHCQFEMIRIERHGLGYQYDCYIIVGLLYFVLCCLLHTFCDCNVYCILLVQLPLSLQLDLD